MFKKLPKEIQAKAALKEDLFRTNPFDPRLRTHKLHAALAEYWGFWIDNRNRIIFRFVSPEEVYFYKIGDHSIYG